MDRNEALLESTFRNVAQRELDERIQGVADRLADEFSADDEFDPRPRWITSARLIRLMRPFISHN